MTDYTDLLRARVRRLETQPPPAPWRNIQTVAVGGLLAVGFGTSEMDLLLAVSSAGRGVLDCATGEWVARDGGELGEWLDGPALTAQGVGPLDGESVRLAGLWGGGLSRMTSDQWVMTVVPVDWPVDERVILEPPGSDFISDRNAADCRQIGTSGVVEIKAAGFSPSGRSAVVATSADVTLFVR